MIQHSIGSLAFSMVVGEPGFYPVALPSRRGQGVNPGPSASGWEEGEGSVVALTRGVRGQDCRQHTPSPGFHCSEVHHLAAPRKDTGTCGPPGRALTGEGKHTLESTGFLCHTFATVHMAPDRTGEAVGKKSTACMDVVFEWERAASIIFNLWIHNFNEERHNSNQNGRILALAITKIFKKIFIWKINEAYNQETSLSKKSG